MVNQIFNEVGAFIPVDMAMVVEWAFLNMNLIDHILLSLKGKILEVIEVLLQFYKKLICHKLINFLAFSLIRFILYHYVSLHLQERDGVSGVAIHHLM